MKFSPRHAITLVELLLVIAVLVILIAILLPGVQQVRIVAEYARGENVLRQIGIATHSYIQQNASRLPRNTAIWEATAHPAAQVKDSDFHRSANAQLLPYLGFEALHHAIFDQGKSPDAPEIALADSMRLFQNPLDPTISQASSRNLAACSYVNNAQVFSMSMNVNNCDDGLSNTIFFTEHYGVCGNIWFDLFDIHNSRGISVTDGLGASAPTFADYGYSPLLSDEPPDVDYYPLTQGTPARTTSTMGITFQSQPRAQDCDPRQPNAASTRGLQVLMGDGSVRTVAAGVSPFIFWAAVTPNGAEPDLPDF